MPTAKPTREELDLTSQLLIRWNHDWDHARPYFDCKKDEYLAYKFFRDPNSHPYKYNPSIPLVFTIVENMTSTVFNSYFAKPRVVEILPAERNHQFLPQIRDEVIARQLQKVMNILMLHPDREYMLERKDLDLETMLFGNGYTLTIPEFDTSRTSDIGGPVYIGPRTGALSFWDVIPDRRCYRFSNSRWIWVKEEVTWVELKEREEREGYFNIEFIKDNPKSWDLEDFHEDALNKLKPGARPDDANDPKNDKYLILHNYDTKTGHFKTLGGNRILIRDSERPTEIETALGKEKIVIKPYPYNPYDDIRLWGFPKEFFAMGVGAVAKGFQDNINLMRSQRLENVELALHKVFVTARQFDVDPDELYMIPGGVIETTDIERAVKVLETGDVTGSSYTEQGIDEKQAQDATSSQETTRGNTPGRRETATAIVQLNRNAMKRLEAFMRQKSGSMDVSIYRKVMIQIRTYMSPREYMRILGEQDAGILPDTA